jgi:hypothetical protein
MRSCKRRSFSNRRTPDHAIAVIEWLEQRTLLSANVLVSVNRNTHDVTITGDRKGDHVGIESCGPALEIYALDPGTKINGHSSYLITGTTRDVTVLLDGGNDFLKVGGGSSTTDIVRNLIINEAGGQNTLQVSATDIGGNLQIGRSLQSCSFGSNAILIGADAADDVTIGGNLSVFGGRGSDLIAIQNTDVTGNASFYTDGGNETVLLGIGDPRCGSNIPNGPVSIGGNLIVNTGTGNDEFVIYGSSVAGTTNVSMGSGNDRAASVGSTFDGDVTVDLGSGNDRLWSENSTYNGAGTLKGGTGNDVIGGTGNVFTGFANIDGGAGNDTVLVNAIDPTLENTFNGGYSLTNFETQDLTVTYTDPLYTINFGWLDTLLSNLA